MGDRNRVWLERGERGEWARVSLRERAKRGVKRCERVPRAFEKDHLGSDSA